MKRILVAVILAAFFVVIIGFMREMTTQTKLGPDLQQELGFRLGSPYIFVNGKGSEVMALNGVQPGGIFDKAGFKTGDIFSSAGVLVTSIPTLKHHAASK